jgi:hypothetical protein
MSKLPQTPGYYFWYICDWSYFEVGAVEVSKDTEKHLAYLRDPKNRYKPEKYAHPYIYQNDTGETLTMYHQANGGDPHLPHRDENDKPFVDGYVPFDFHEFMNKTVGGLNYVSGPPPKRIPLAKEK